MKSNVKSNGKMVLEKIGVVLVPESNALCLARWRRRF
jgi:hypothetical protein